MTILPKLEDDLFRAAKERLPASDTRHTATTHRGLASESIGRSRRLRDRLAATATALPIALAIAITVIIAALALTLFHHRERTRPAAPPASTRTARQELIQTLAVLRRPQTKADLDPKLAPGFVGLEAIPKRLVGHRKRPPADLERTLAKWGYPKLDRSLVRVVRIPAWPAKVGIEPSTLRVSPSSRPRSEGVDLSLWVGSGPTIPPSTEDGTGPLPTSIETLKAHGLALTAKAPGREHMDGVILVPDGVASITLHVLRVTKAPVRVPAGHFATVTGRVHDNLAMFQLPIPTVFSRDGVSSMFGTAAIAQTTWFDASGKVIKHTTTTVNVLVRFARA